VVCPSSPQKRQTPLPYHSVRARILGVHNNIKFQTPCRRTLTEIIDCEKPVKNPVAKALSVTIIRLHRMHKMLTIVTDVRDVCLSGCLSRSLNQWRRVQGMPCAWDHSVQPLPNAFGLLLSISHN